MRVLLKYPWARIYLCVLASSRAFVLGLGMSRGFKYYFPHLDVDVHLVFFAGLFILHWIVVMFYHWVSKWIIGLALLVNTSFALFGRIFLLNTFIGLSIQEMAWFGTWFTILIDLVLLCLLVYNVVSARKQFKGNTL